MIVREAPVPASSFLPGVRIRGGAILFDRTTLRWPGDLLHEAGHVAVTPAAVRGQLDDDVDAAGQAPWASEVEATAWAYAATIHLGLDPAVLFHEGGYRGRSRDLIETFALGGYPGAFGLAEAGLTLVGPEAVRRGHATYPRMLAWLRD